MPRRGCSRRYVLRGRTSSAYTGSIIVAQIISLKAGAYDRRTSDGCWYRLGTKSHCVCIVDEAGNRVNQFDVSHSGKDIELLGRQATCFVSPKITRVLVGIETKHGAVVEGLVLHGFSVYSINLKQSDRFRDRHSPSGAKSDDLDAWRNC